MLGCTASTAIGSVNKLAKMKKNQTVAISGCGALGLSIIKVCKIGGAKNIIVIDINKKNISLAKKFGATFCINNSKSDFKKIILNKFPNLIDHFFECTGNIKIISDAYECLNTNGNQILIGVPQFKQKASFYTLDLHLGKSLIGCKGGNFQPHKDLASYLKIINKKEFQLKKHITSEVELKDINDVFSDMKRNKLAGKCIVNLM
jgi:Zn-dependent alcohol dehydrogenase